MVSPNLTNFITVGLIAVIAIVAVRFGAKALGKSSPV